MAIQAAEKGQMPDRERPNRGKGSCHPQSLQQDRHCHSGSCGQDRAASSTRVGLAPLSQEELQVLARTRTSVSNENGLGMTKTTWRTSQHKVHVQEERQQV